MSTDALQSLILLAVAATALLNALAIWMHGSRLKKLERRPWPTEVVQWRRVYDYDPNCRCSIGRIEDSGHPQVPEA